MCELDYSQFRGGHLLKKLTVMDILVCKFLQTVNILNFITTVKFYTVYIFILDLTIMILFS